MELKLTQPPVDLIQGPSENRSSDSAQLVPSIEAWFSRQVFVDWTFDQ